MNLSPTVRAPQNAPTFLLINFSVSPPPRQYTTFPLAHPPKCPTCGIASRNRKKILAGNPNGNFGRPYYVCEPCKEKGWVWITWDDNRGIYANNPECDCGLVSRRDRAGAKRTSEGGEFWKCATGKCDYWENVYIEEEAERLKGP